MTHIKFYLSCAFLSLLFFNVHSQAIFAPVKNAKWTYIGGFSDYTGGNDTYLNYHQVIKASYNKDTLIKGVNYKLILISNDIAGVRIAPIIDTKTGRKVGQDTTPYTYQPTGKIMIRQSNDSLLAIENSDTLERLYFVYLPGPDTIKLKHSNLTRDSNKVFIDSLSSFLISGNSYKSWKGRSFAITSGDIIKFGTSPLTFLDRIGPLDDFFRYSAFDGAINHFLSNYPYGLVCYEDPDVGLLKFKNLDCNISLKVATNDLINKASIIDCHYDPNSEKIIISSSRENLEDWRFALIDINGRAILVSSLSTHFNSIDINIGQTNGLYLVYFYNKYTLDHLVKKILIYH